jgi:VCBS repeat-containing protein
MDIDIITPAMLQFGMQALDYLNTLPAFGSTVITNSPNGQQQKIDYWRDQLTANEAIILDQIVGIINATPGINSPTQTFIGPRSATEPSVVGIGIKYARIQTALKDIYGTGLKVIYDQFRWIHVMVAPPPVPTVAQDAAASAMSQASALQQVHGVSSQKTETVLQVALSDWASLSSAARADLTYAEPLVQFTALAAETLGQTQLYGNSISLSNNAAGYGWYIDPNPTSNAAFLPTSDPDVFIAPQESPAYGKMDLLTVELHELGHVLGVGEVDPTTAPNDLMNQVLPTGMRRLPSPLDVQLIAEALANRAGEAAFDQSAPLGLQPTNEDIVNGSFSVSDSSALNFGWTLLGAASVGSGSLTLDESPSAATEAFEDFSVPTGARSLSFTLTGLDFASNGGGPADAFEMALLGNDGQPAVGTINLTNTDAAFNVQGDGTFFASPKVHVLGGASNNLGSGPVTVDVDLSGVAAGSPLRLYFDLIGFGPAGSEVKISNVQLLTNTGATTASDVSGAAYEHGPSVTLAASYSDPIANDTPLFAIDTTTDATKGKVTDNGDGTFAYDPNGAFQSLRAGQTATDQFLYTVTDGSGASSTATVTVTITGQNDPPVASNASGAVQEHGPATTVVASYTDPDSGDTHAFAIDTKTDATKGKVTDNGDGTFTYDPNGAFESLRAGQTATDQFLYTVTDGSGASSTATVAITITGQNDAPVAANVSGAVSERGPAGGGELHRPRCRRRPYVRPRPHDRRPTTATGPSPTTRTAPSRASGLGRPRPTSSSTPCPTVRARPRRRRSPSRSPVRTMPRLRPTSAAPFRNTGPRRR